MASEETDTPERVELAEGDEPVAPVEDTRTLGQRLAAIRDECFGIGKQDIQMGTFKIKGHTFEAVLSEIRPLLAKHGVDMTPNLVERTYSGNRCDVVVDFTFETLREPFASRTVRWGGAGTDNGDKAFAKAGTNAVKEMLKKLFLVTDRDDAKEEEEKVEHKAEGAIDATAEAARLAKQQEWAQTFKAALDGAPTAKAVGLLEATNAQNLSELPPVTKTYFIELIQSRKAELKAKDQ